VEAGGRQLAAGPDSPRRTAAPSNRENSQL